MFHCFEHGWHKDEPCAACCYNSNLYPSTSAFALREINRLQKEISGLKQIAFQAQAAAMELAKENLRLEARCEGLATALADVHARVRKELESAK